MGSTVGEWERFIFECGFGKIGMVMVDYWDGYGGFKIIVGVIIILAFILIFGTDRSVYSPFKVI